MKLKKFVTKKCDRCGENYVTTNESKYCMICHYAVDREKCREQRRKALGIIKEKINDGR